MARTTGPKCRLCRREGVKLYLKGARCESEKCAMNKRPYAPGQHGNARKGRVSGYALQFREKQQAKRIYGILEKQFKMYVDRALKAKGVTGEVLMQELESRLDNMIYKGGFATSRGQARQLIRSGFFELNSSVARTPSIQVKAGDVIKPVNFERIHLRQGFVLPEWIKANVKDKLIQVDRLPSLQEVSDSVNVQLIVEFYSR
ncbi:30S ribosomal protein S4 [candidate division WWE3 bacterium]|nr:30S ribosomal protein S4 [candidate division WWE3 bacterium]